MQTSVRGCMVKGALFPRDAAPADLPLYCGGNGYEVLVASDVVGMVP